MGHRPEFTCLLQGSDTLTIHCGGLLVEAGHDIVAVITKDDRVAQWAQSAGVAVHDVKAAETALADADYDWVISAANTDIIPDAVLSRARLGGVNFHDGPLPRYAGLNAPVWALLQGETHHGITWHMISGGIDEGDIVAARSVELAADDTALTANAKCFSAGIEAFGDVIVALETGLQDVTAQDLSDRTYFGRNARPEAGALIDLSRPTEEILRLVRALDHGEYHNPLSSPKLLIGDQVVLVGRAEALVEGVDAPPGTVLAVQPDRLNLATGDGAVRLSLLRDAMGAPSVVSPEIGTVLPQPDRAQIDAALRSVVAADRLWAGRFAAYQPALWCTDLPSRGYAERSLTGSPAILNAAFAAVVSALAGPDPVDLAWAVPGAVPGATLPWHPLRFDPTTDWAHAKGSFDVALERVRTNRGISADLPARCPEMAQRRMPDAAISDTGPLPGAALTLILEATGRCRLVADTARLSETELDLIAARLAHLAGHLPDLPGDTVVAHLPMLPAPERDLVLAGFNATEADFDQQSCLHQLIEAQARLTPDAVAVAFEDQSLTYGELETAANRLAHVLRGLGVGPDQPVGLHVRRSADLLIGALGILKAGGAYLPLDPAYPADRIALYIEDSGTRVIVAETALSLETEAEVLNIDADPRLVDAPSNPPENVTKPGDLAYMIYTSGSTGRPKGVMIEHRNVSNFFTGMDARIDHPAGSVLLAVTSLSFDISVLELFWTLARGFKVVISDEAKMVAGAAPGPRAGGVDFSLFYWGNDDGVGRDKYGLLLEGARFADENGFTAIWTPERHFHAFGGLYPNPSVTGAAVAAITKNIAVRAGSCVAPLHHVARIAEEWAVIDNLTDGRAGLAIASGWQPDDFVLRPENAPPDNKPAMFDAIRDLRKLWVGEEVAFAKADGTSVARLTQPRPVSTDLPVWVTTAGNPETWRQAGEIGANVLTHLLGQSVEEVGEKIKIYHVALRDAGHNPDDFTVTLMLHSYLAEDRETAREIARAPMKNYLRSAADLIKQYAWAFPAFKRPEGVDNARQIDLGSLEDGEMEAILDFAFERYFEKSGLFGTVEDALARVDEVKAIGVTEVACLIDFGIERQVVLDGLRPLAEVVAASQGAGDTDTSLAGLIGAHGVTHLQCTPYMARMLVTNDAARAALGRLDHMMVGGEALSRGLIGDLEAATKAHIENMYGPTETTIWSTTATVNGVRDTAVPIGAPIANTQIYILDDRMEPCPVGVSGEMYIAGDGVTRGYWGRDDLTAEKFLDDPFRPGNRMFRTGDTARWRADGQLIFLGRADAQVKLRGYRIELGEIEAALEAATDVEQAVVVVRKDASGVGQLIGYVTGSADVAQLKTDLGTELPSFMVPQQIIALEAFPLTPNKKIDRKALPVPGAQARAPVPVPTPRPKSQDMVAQVMARVETSDISVAEASAAVAAIWQDLLKLDRITPSDNFFDLGGHSLLAVEMHRAVQKKLGLRQLTIADIFRAPTFKGFLARIEALLAPARGPVDAIQTRPALSKRPKAVVFEPAKRPESKITSRRRTMRQNL